MYLTAFYNKWKQPLSLSLSFLSLIIAWWRSEIWSKIRDIDIFSCCYMQSNTFVMPQLQQSNFHSNLSHNFGRKALETFRFIERRTISDAKWSNNLHFNLSLRRFQIFFILVILDHP